MNKKLLLFDVDGTLVSYEGIVPQSCVDALKQAKDNGHYVFVVTGRTRNRAVVGSIEVSGMICGNGAYIECEGKVLKDQKLSLEDVKEITDYLDHHDFVILWKVMMDYMVLMILKQGLYQLIKNMVIQAHLKLVTSIQ